MLERSEARSHTVRRPVREPVELGVTECRHWVRDHGHRVRGHSERDGETRGETLEGVGDDERSGDPEALELDGVVQTARCARASVAESGDDEV